MFCASFVSLMVTDVFWQIILPMYPDTISGIHLQETLSSTRWRKLYRAEDGLITHQEQCPGTVFSLLDI